MQGGLLVRKVLSGQDLGSHVIYALPTDAVNQDNLSLSIECRLGRGFFIVVKSKQYAKVTYSFASTKIQGWAYDIYCYF